jgi:hypothetical protein
MDVPDAPKLTKGLAVYKWLESVRNHLNQVIEVCYAPLSYVICEIAMVNPVSPVLQVGEPFAVEYGSVEGEMIARLSHTHPLFKSDNGQVFDVIEAALHGTSISPSIAQFHKTRDGRAAYLALVSQHAGRDKNPLLNLPAGPLLNLSAVCQVPCHQDVACQTNQEANFQAYTQANQLKS